MTTCAECLDTLASTRLSEMRYDAAVLEHCATCERCSSVATDIRYAEERLAMTLSELRPGVPAVTIADGAIAGSERYRRRSIARWIRRGLAAVAALILTTYIVDNRSAGPRLETETLMVKCISSETAAEIVTPYLRSNGSAVYSPKGARAITIRATSEEMAAAEMQLKNFDSEYCNVPVSPDVISPSGNADQPYMEFQVDKPVAQIPGTGALRYPSEMRSSGIGGEVQAQFVVNAAGIAEPKTFKILKTTNDTFADAVRSALTNMRFSPAERGGKKVSQLVQQSFTFKLDK